MEQAGCLELNGHWPISQNFLLDIPLRYLTETESTDLSGCTYFGDWFALCEFRARLALGGSFVTSAAFFDQMSMFHEIAIQVRPSTLASFIQEVAAENLLRRKFWNILSAFES